MHLCRGALSQPPPAPRPPRMKNKSTKTWSAWGGEVADLSKEKGPEPFPPWAFIRFICAGIQIKLINHCREIRVKQYMIWFTENFEGLFWVTDDSLEGYKTLGTRLISGLDPYLLSWGYKLSRFHRNVCIFLRPDSSGNLPLPAQDCTALCYCFRLKSGKGSKAAKRLGDFL